MMPDCFACKKVADYVPVVGIPVRDAFRASLPRRRGRLHSGRWGRDAHPPGQLGDPPLQPLPDKLLITQTAQQPERRP
jgi:hypothetical protein